MLYVVLQENTADRIYKAKAVFSNKPSLSDGEVALKGRVDYVDNESIRITYGIEQYYVKENTGKELEEQAGSLVVKLKVAAWGSPVVEDVALASKAN